MEFFLSIVCTCNMMNARPFLSVALYSTAIAGHCFIYVTICCCFVLSLLLLFVAFDVLIVYCTFLGNMRDLYAGDLIYAEVSQHIHWFACLTDLITFTQSS